MGLRISELENGPRRPGVFTPLGNANLSPSAILTFIEHEWQWRVLRLVDLEHKLKAAQPITNSDVSLRYDLLRWYRALRLWLKAHDFEALFQAPTGTVPTKNMSTHGVYICQIGQLVDQIVEDLRQSLLTAQYLAMEDIDSLYFIHGGVVYSSNFGPEVKNFESGVANIETVDYWLPTIEMKEFEERKKRISQVPKKRYPADWLIGKGVFDHLAHETFGNELA